MYLEFLLEHRPAYGYLPEVEKSYYVCKAEDEDVAREAFERRSLDIQMSHGRDYLGGFIGSAASKHVWLEAKCKMWVTAVATLAQIAVKYPQQPMEASALSCRRKCSMCSVWWRTQLSFLLRWKEQ